MRQFDKDNYEPVKERKARFYKDNPDGRIVVEQINLPGQILECAEFKAYAYKNGSDQEKNLPWATGHALEIRDKELSVSRDGKKYESVNYTSWTENAEESAVGRALDNAGYAGSPSREEMKKVERHTEILSKTKTFVEEPQDHFDFSSEISRDEKRTASTDNLATLKQKEAITKIANQAGHPIAWDELGTWTKSQASMYIKEHGQGSYNKIKAEQDSFLSK